MVPLQVFYLQDVLFEVLLQGTAGFPGLLCRVNAIGGRHVIGELTYYRGVSSGRKDDGLRNSIGRRQ